MVAKAIVALQESLPDFVPAYLALCEAQRVQREMMADSVNDILDTVRTVAAELPADVTEADPFKATTSIEKLDMFYVAVSGGNVAPNRQTEWGPMPNVIDHIVQTAGRERKGFVEMTDARDVARFDALVGYVAPASVVKEQIEQGRRRVMDRFLAWFTSLFDTED